jgi:DNA (cytosine-5)-methyltransferase 1
MNDIRQTPQNNLSVFDFLDFPVFSSTQKIKLFEAFSGIGTQAMALKRLGVSHEIVGFSEIDKHVIKSYHAIHGEHIKNYGDISQMDEIPQCDLCTWSFPCTDLSKAGTQRGMQDGTHSNYGYTFLEVVKQSKHKPKVLLMENVPDLVSKKFKKDFKRIKHMLSSMGYENHWRILNAKHYGIAQNRKRVFMISILHGGYYEFPQPQKQTKVLLDFLEDPHDIKDTLYLSEKKIKQILSWNSLQSPIKNAKSTDAAYIQTITAKSNTSMNASMVLIKNKTICLNSKVDGKQPSLQDRVYDAQGISTAITTGFRPAIAIRENTHQGYKLAHHGDGIYINRPHQKRGVVQHQMMPTLKANMKDIGVVIDVNTSQTWSKQKIHEVTSPVITTQKKLAVFNGYTFRYLTPLEAWRLMGVTDEDFYKAQQHNSNTQLYKQAGNAIVVNVLIEIFRNLFPKNSFKDVNLNE